MSATDSMMARRASGSEKRRRTIVVPMRCSAEEKAELVRRAGEAGIPVAAYIRRQTLDVAPPRMRPRPIPTRETQVLSLLLGQLGKVGGNLNQIAHHLNVDPKISVYERQALNTALTELAELRAAVMRALGREP